MALETPVITIQDVTEPQGKLYHITLHMAVADDVPALLGIDVSHTIRYRTGQNIADKEAEFTAFFQEEIDKYKRVTNIATSQALSNSKTAIQSGLVI